MSEHADDSLVGLHLRWGWWSLLTFMCLGLVLESLHGFKVAWYLAHSHETRRLMFTLAHAHGTLLALVHIAFAATLGLRPVKARRGASVALRVSSILLPLGFFAGGIVLHGGDPNLGILLAPLGAFALLGATALTATSLGRS